VPFGSIVHRIKRHAPSLIRILDAEGRAHPITAFSDSAGVAQVADLATGQAVDLYLSAVHPIELGGAKILRMRNDFRALLIVRGTSRTIEFGTMPKAEEVSCPT
jgi:hypothetical protein